MMAEKKKAAEKAPEQADEMKAPTFAEAAEQVPSVEGDKYEKGYDGFVPSRDGDNPEDLTLPAVLKRLKG